MYFGTWAETVGSSHTFYKVWSGQGGGECGGRAVIGATALLIGQILFPMPQVAEEAGHPMAALSKTGG